ncbi:hypothetical protein NKJ06_31985 [Mesorhizobium sp. M0293]|uniref:hypothetical protein n=1 Tax=unclassified Mesorhizobium TaxID=325217 RepID=UPI0033382A98
MAFATRAGRHKDLIGGLVVLAGTLKPDFAPDHPLVAGVQVLRDPILPADPFYAWWHACRPGVPTAFLAGLAKDEQAVRQVKDYVAGRLALRELATAGAQTGLGWPAPAAVEVHTVG